MSWAGNLIDFDHSIFQNGGLGIDLGEDGATPNDDGDTGPNNLQNVPDLSTAVIDGPGNLLVTYAVDTGAANATYPLTIEFFLADVDDEEGQTFVGRDTYATAQVQQAGNLGRSGGSAHPSLRGLGQSSCLT